MKKVLLIVVSLLIVLMLTQAFAEQDGLYTYEINSDNTVTITGFDWKNNHGDIYIPEMLGNRMVSAIGEKAFMTTGNTAVKITLPDNIKSIAEQAFRGVAITYVNIPLNTVEIGGGAFAQCTVSRFNVASGHQVFATIDNALYNKQTKTLIAWPENKEISKIPNGIIEIGDYAFYGRDGDFYLPDSITRIGRYAFAYENLYGRNSLYITGKNISEIDDYSFYEARVSFENQMSLSRIGAHAFEASEVRLYSDNDSVLISNTPFTVDEYAFYNSEMIRTINNYPDIEIKNIVSVGQYAFSADKDNYLRKRVYIQEDSLDNLHYIGENAFEGIGVDSRDAKEDYLEDADFYETLEALYGEEYAYGSSSRVALVNSSLTIIPDNAFIHSAILSVKCGSSIVSIGKSAFEDCWKLKKVDLEDGLLSINDRAFFECCSLKEIYIPKSVTMIGQDAFTGCSDKLVITVEAGSYGEVWARTSGYSYVINGQEEDTSWLD